MLTTSDPCSISEHVPKLVQVLVKTLIHARGATAGLPAQPRTFLHQVDLRPPDSRSPAPPQSHQAEPGGLICAGLCSVRPRGRGRYRRDRRGTRAASRMVNFPAGRSRPRPLHAPRIHPSREGGELPQTHAG